MARSRNGRCKHFTGVQHKTCQVGIDYETFRTPTSFQLPCITTECATCEKREYPTQAEIDADESAMQRTLDLMRRGLSSCCEAAFDERAVIKEGRHKGHGSRFCSKCGKLCFMV